VDVVPVVVPVDVPLDDPLDDPVDVVVEPPEDVEVLELRVARTIPTTAAISTTAPTRIQGNGLRFTCGGIMYGDGWAGIGGG
jgi:hypothetical protein